MATRMSTMRPACRAAAKTERLTARTAGPQRVDPFGSGKFGSTSYGPQVSYADATRSAEASRPAPRIAAYAHEASRCQNGLDTGCAASFHR